MPIDDLTAAFDYYFEHYNGGRPFIIAGHSQGSGILLVLLRTYFKDHPEYYARMIAAYTIGFSVTDKYLAANPHLKFAAGESDTGVIIAWNTEGPRNVETNANNILLLPGTVVTNAEGEQMPEELAKAAVELYGPDGHHNEDYTFFYNNIKDNVAKRIASYLAQ